jgi:acetyl/propionyl-CoA carboxylase alpha subunit
VSEITRLLIANRGEIASRIVRTARRLGISTVAVFSDSDADLPYVHDADVAVRLPGTAPGATYLDVDAILRAARVAGADAVHPGYGFLSEHAGFARACDAAGLTFVGPPAEVIDAMGSKVEAKRRMGDAGVPVLPGIMVSADTATVELEQAADEIGFPLLVKAEFGGGGRGMRTVREHADLLDAVAGAQREAESAFGDGSVFLERSVERPRHVEVQIFGDTQGTVVHLFERECSIQRRHQKVIEEAPSPAVDAGLRSELGAAAVAAAKAIGYVGAGTVEFVLDAGGAFWFLEVNTRLQVEHPVTELVTGLDLVALQLEVAAGHPLPAAVLDAGMVGHAIEARLYAEDVPSGFLPTSGPIPRFRIPGGPDVRVDAGYADGSVVSTHYDGMLAKVIAWAPTRAAAVARLADVLFRSELHGPTTNRDLLVRTLRHPEFVAGNLDTSFLERHDAAVLGAADDSAALLELHAVAAVLAGGRAAAAKSVLPPGIPPAWRNVGRAEQPLTLRHGERELVVLGSVTHDGPEVSVDGVAVDVRVLGVTEGSVDVEVAGVRHRVRVKRVDDVVYADSASGSTVMRVVDRFPDHAREGAAGSLHAPLPGTVTRVLVSEGDAVSAGQPLLALEAMKMEHTITAAHDGIVSHLAVAVGDQVEPTAVLLVVTGPDDAP